MNYLSIIITYKLPRLYIEKSTIFVFNHFERHSTEGGLIIAELSIKFNSLLDWLHLRDQPIKYLNLALIPINFISD